MRDPVTRRDRYAADAFCTKGEFSGWLTSCAWGCVTFSHIDTAAPNRKAAGTKEED